MALSRPHGATTVTMWTRAAGAAGRSGVAEPVPLTFVPYRLWGNRGPATMRVWLPES